MNKHVNIINTLAKLVSMYYVILGNLLSRKSRVIVRYMNLPINTYYQKGTVNQRSREDSRILRYV